MYRKTEVGTKEAHESKNKTEYPFSPTLPAKPGLEGTQRSCMEPNQLCMAQKLMNAPKFMSAPKFMNDPKFVNASRVCITTSGFLVDLTNKVSSDSGA